MSGKKLEFIISHGEESLIMDILKILKEKYDYKTLSKITGLPISTLNRYCTGKSTPKGKRIMNLINKIIPMIDIEKIIKENIIIDENGHIDSSALFLNANILKILSLYALDFFAGRKITCIIAFDELSISLATSIALISNRKLLFLSNSPFCEIKDNFLYFIYSSFGENNVYWLPKKYIKMNESVLIIMSNAFNSNKINSFFDFLKRMNVFVSGIFSVIGKKDEWDKINFPLGSKNTCLILF